MEFREREGISFEEAEHRHAELKRRYDADLINEEEFDAERQRLVVRDDQGRSWAMSRESGRWLYHDGTGAWIEATPPGFRRRGASDSPERLEPLKRAEYNEDLAPRGGAKSQRHCANCRADVGSKATFCARAESIWSRSRQELTLFRRWRRTGCYLNNPDRDQLGDPEDKPSCRLVRKLSW